MIVSNTLVGVELLYVLAAGFSLAAMLIAILFFVMVVATELLFSTKVGDLGKMANEFKKRPPVGSDPGHSPKGASSESSNSSSLTETSSGSMPSAFNSRSASCSDISLLKSMS